MTRSGFPLFLRFLLSPFLPCPTLPVSSSSRVRRIFCLAESCVWSSAFKLLNGTWTNVAFYSTKGFNSAVKRHRLALESPHIRFLMISSVFITFTKY
uniref:Secreted protein n=1 Tax=Ixodes ricinus TaxID=34613 RepID=A0A6B0UEV2_IXORI